MCLAGVQAPRIQEWTWQNFYVPGVIFIGVTIFRPSPTPTPPAHLQVWPKRSNNCIYWIRWLSFWRYPFLEFRLNSKARQKYTRYPPFSAVFNRHVLQILISQRASGTSGSSEGDINLPTEKEGLPHMPSLFPFRIQSAGDTPSPA